MCLILDGYRDRAVRISLLHFCLLGWMKREIYIRKVDTRDELLVRILFAAARKKTREDQNRLTTRDFACDLQSALGLMGGFRKFILTVTNLSFKWHIKIKPTVCNFRYFTIHNDFVCVDSTSSTSVIIQI